GFNAMHELLRLALGGNQIKPAPCDHQIQAQSEHAVRDRIAVMMVIKKPGTELALLERRLNGVEIHGSILLRICNSEPSEPSLSTYLMWPWSSQGSLSPEPGPQGVTAIACAAATPNSSSQTQCNCTRHARLGVCVRLRPRSPGRTQDQDHRD